MTGAIQRFDEESTGLSIPDKEARRIAIMGWQLVRELLPTKMESDEAFAARVEFLKEIVQEVGGEAFIEAVRNCIRHCEFRNDVSVARIRKECGLSLTPVKSPAQWAWELVTTVVKNHIGRDGMGNAVLEPKVVIQRGTMLGVITAVPNIPDAVADAVEAMGGWGALAESHPHFWGMRLQQFEKLYRP